jgi:hypothetical protein
VTAARAVRIKFYQTGSFAAGNRLLPEDLRSIQSGGARANALTCGHRARQGCGESPGARYALDAVVRVTAARLAHLGQQPDDRPYLGCVALRPASGSGPDARLDRLVDSGHRCGEGDYRVAV